ncbi:hypothetical protein [Novosphingobium sp. MBES04]|uniref:hypothetical protein n=1 Tax=Novosphingobium sp. MBES04 TaxID=1206458 RepID=UPI0005800786|nr:hypothetical protein [Novosphingobium sp. MBES04]GAM07137.1 hypothetical protein MBENS4_4133 [Novosphingobium sp. MBES04]
MSHPRKSPLGTLLQARRDRVGALFVALAIVTAFLPPTAFALVAGLEALALVLALRTARAMTPEERAPMSILGHISAVVAGSLVCVFFISRYVHYISFQTQAVASVLLIGALAILLVLRRPVH